jgi:hypothetical protein
MYDLRAPSKHLEAPVPKTLILLTISANYAGPTESGHAKIRFDALGITSDALRIRFDALRIRFDALRMKFDAPGITSAALRIAFDTARISPAHEKMFTARLRAGLGHGKIEASLAE